MRDRSVMIPLVLIIILKSPVLLSEHHATLRGYITQADGIPAAGVQVILQLEQCDCQLCNDPAACDCCPGLTLTITSTEGYYVMIVPPGTYSLRVKKPDGEPHREYGLYLAPDTETVRNIRLR